jgi:hypothetical protein
VLAYATPAGGVALTPVAPVGLRDRGAGTVAFTTSNGFGRKLDRIDQNPRVALAYHAREHGFASGTRFVLVQGTATSEREPDPKVLEEKVRPASTRFMGAPKTGVFWDRWLRVYYTDRVLVTVEVDRVTSWPDDACRGEVTVVGEPAARQEPASQKPPRKGIWPRVDVKRVDARLRRVPHLLLGYIGGDGFPVITPVSVSGVEPSGLRLAGHLPAGKRRAGLLGHRYERQLVGLEVHQYTGWLQDGIYAPHTENGFRAPSNKTALLLVNGFMARQGLRKAQRASAGGQPARD